MVRGVCATVRMPMLAPVRDIPAEWVLSVMASIRNVVAEAIMIGAAWLASANRSFNILVAVPAMPEVWATNAIISIRVVAVAPDMVGEIMYVLNVRQNISLIAWPAIMTQILPAVVVRPAVKNINIVAARADMVGKEENVPFVMQAARLEIYYILIIVAIVALWKIRRR